MGCEDDCVCDPDESSWVDLASDIFRQRLVIEGTLRSPFCPEDMTVYCQEITTVLNMTHITTPICNYDPDYGWCAYTHWKESGMHIYSWDDHKPSFFSVDIYTCKPFEVKHAINYTREFFDDNLIKLVWKE
jgi:S-adenosylmethionine decarboxylase